MNILTSFALVSQTCSLSDLPQLEMTTPDIQRIYFVRHGESELNLSNKIARENGQKIIICGQNLQIKLTSTGKKQASNFGQMLQEKFSKEGKISILSSAAVRAQETAHLIFKELQEKGFAVKCNDQSYNGFCEISEGKYEGKPITEEYQTAVKTWEGLSAKDKFYISPLPHDETAESYHQVAQRILKDLQTILENHTHETLIIVSHTVALNALALQLSERLNELSQTPGSELPKLNLDNCDMLMVEIPSHTSVHQGEVKMHIISRAKKDHT